MSPVTRASAPTATASATMIASLLVAILSDGVRGKHACVKQESTSSTTAIWSLSRTSHRYGASGNRRMRCHDSTIGPCRRTDGGWCVSSSQTCGTISVRRPAWSIQQPTSFLGVGVDSVLASNAGPIGSSTSTVGSLCGRLGFRQRFRKRLGGAFDVPVFVVGASVAAVPVADLHWVGAWRHGTNVEFPRRDVGLKSSSRQSAQVGADGVAHFDSSVLA